MLMETRDQTVDRFAKRKRVLMTGVLFTPDGAIKVRVRDISATGANLHADIRMLPDCDAVFKKGPVFAAARVAWCRDRDVGINFYRELTEQEVAQLFHPVVLEGER
ncbi:MAG TPA: PilZ domain-containing protein [Sphingomicrobium sp.]|nr:PilZ domain-containing protein [Sphingomicrobium sp.]